MSIFIYTYILFVIYLKKLVVIIPEKDDAIGSSLLDRPDIPFCTSRARVAQLIGTGEGD